MRRLAQSDATNAGWQRDLSYTLKKMAGFQMNQGDLRQALSLAQESQAIDERLVAIVPSNKTWQRDLEFSRDLVAQMRGMNP